MVSRWYKIFLKFGFITITLAIIAILFWENASSLAISAEHPYQEINILQIDSQNERQEPLGDGTYLRILIDPESQTVYRGDEVEFTIIVLNTNSRVNLTNVVVDAPLAPDCNRNIGNLAANSNFPPYQCTATNVQEPFSNEVTVSGKNPINKHMDEASVAVQVNILDMEIDLKANPGILPEPGGEVTFTMSISNTGNLDISLMGLESEQLGDVTDPKNPNLKNNNCIPDPTLPELLAGIGTSSCTFKAELTSQPGDLQIDIEATAEDIDGTLLTKNGRATIQISDTPASMTAELITDSKIAYGPKQTKTFTARIDNTSPVDKIAIQGLIDSNIGNLNGIGNCSLPQTVTPGSFYQCNYDSEISGNIGDIKTINLQAIGEDDDNPPGEVEATHQIKIEFQKPPIYSVFFPIASHLKDEPNNTCRSAYPIDKDKYYWFMAEDREDWYSLELSEKTNLQLELSNYKPLSGQVIFYQGACGSLNYIMHNGNFLETKTLNLGQQDPGQYFVRIFTAERFNNITPYRLIISGN